MKNWIFVIFSFTLFFQEIGFFISSFSSIFYFFIKGLKIDHKRIFGRFHIETEEKKVFDFYGMIKKIDYIQSISYYEILNSGTIEEKMNLLGLIVFHPRRENVVLAKYALEDKDETIRILAATTLQKMETIYIEELKKAENEHQCAKYIDIMYNYIESGLIDEEMKPGYIMKMINCSKKYDKFLEDRKSMFLIVKLSTFYNLIWDENIFDDYLKLTGEHDYIFFKAVHLYKNGNFYQAESVLKSIDFKKIKSRQIKKKAKFWLESKNG